MEQRFSVHRSNAVILSDARLAGSESPAFSAWLPVSSLELREALAAVLAQAGFLHAEIDRNADFALGVVQDPGPRGPLNLASRKQIQLAWAPHQTERYQTYVEWVVFDEGRRPAVVFDQRMATQVGRGLWARALEIEVERNSRPEEIVLGPGERLEDSAARKLLDFDPNRFWDYSALATPGQTAELREGRLPLGRYVEFFKPERGVLAPAEYAAGPMLRVGGSGRKDLAILVHGAAGAGKSTFAANAIAEASSAGYQVVALDPNGNLMEACRGRLGGDVRLVSILGSVAYLPRAGVSMDAAERTIEQIGEILLAREDLRRSESSLLARSGDWLSSIMMIHRLAGALPEGGVEPGFPGLQALLTDESRLVSAILKVEESAAGNSGLRAKVSWLESRLADLIAPNRVDWGRREGSLPFAHFTSLMVRSLQPYVEGAGAAAPAQLEMLNDGAPAALLIHAPGHDRPVQATGMALVQNRLTAVLAARSGAERRRPLLIVADGIERLPGFDPLRLIDLARGSNTSCLFTTAVLRREANAGTGLTSAVGAQVYLTPGSDEVVRALNAQLGRRSRQTMVRDMRTGEGRGVHLTWQPDSEYISQRELSHLPGTARPAIVFAPGLGLRAPVLVEEAVSAATLTVSRSGPYRSIKDALAAAPEGGRILVKPGTWREHLVIRRTVEIAADGPPGSVVIEGPDGVCLTAESGVVTVRGVGLHSPGPSVQVWGATLRLAGCDITGHVDGNSGELFMWNCELTGGELDIGPIQATIEDCRIVARGIDGVLQTGGDAVIRRTEIREAAKACIEAAGDSLLMEDCELSHARFGIIASGSHVVARRCAIHDSGEAAILLVDGGSVDDDQAHQQVTYHA